MSVIRYDVETDHWFLGYYNGSKFVLVAKWPNLDSPIQENWSKTEDNFVTVKNGE